MAVNLNINEELEKKYKELNNKIDSYIKEKLLNSEDITEYMNAFSKLTDEANAFSEAIEDAKNQFGGISTKSLQKVMDSYEKIAHAKEDIKAAEKIINNLNKKLGKVGQGTEEYQLLSENIKNLNENIKKKQIEQQLEQQKITNTVKQTNKHYRYSEKKVKDIFNNLTNLSEDLENSNRNVNELSDNLDDVANNTKKATDEAKKLREEHMKMAEMPIKFLKGLSNIPNKISDIYGQLKDIAKPWLDSDHAVHQMVKTFGLHGNQFEVYKKNMYNVAVTMSKWGKNMEDLVKTQQQYNQATGRNVQLSENAFNKQYELNQIIGEEDGSELTANLELFGHSIETSNELYEDMYKTALKMGISTTKSTKDVLKNLKLAQKYNFNGGVKNMMEMSVWANKTRFNMDNLDGIIEKFSDNFEDTITSAAQIQNLGGNFAMGADPLGMFYESMADPESLAKRLNGMLKGMGSFDTETGETKFNINESMLMRQFAKASGQSVEDVRAQAMEGRRRDYIQNNLISKTSGLTQEQIDLIGSKAQAKGNGEFVVTNNEGKEINVRDIDSSNINTISTDTSETDFLSTIAEQSRSANDKIVAIEKLLENQQAQYMEKYGNKIHNWLGGLYDFLQKNDWVASMIPWFKLTGTIAGILGDILNTIRGFGDLIDLFGGRRGKRGKKGKKSKEGTAKSNTQTEATKKDGNIFKRTIDSIKEKSKGLKDKGFKGIIKSAGKGLWKGAKSLAKRIPLLGSVGFGIMEHMQNNREFEENKTKLEDALKQGLISQEDYETALATLEHNLEAQRWKTWAGAAGGALGSLIPGVGSIFGGIAGDWLGRKAGDMISGGEKELNIDELIYKNQKGYNNVVVSDRELGREVFNDGYKTPHIIQSVKDDSILFAKDGGPFDKLFNDIFKKINDIHDETIIPPKNEISRVSNNILNQNRNAFSTINNRKDIANNSVLSSSDSISNQSGNVIKSGDKNVLNRIKNISNAVLSFDSRKDSEVLSVQPVGDDSIMATGNNSIINNRKDIANNNGTPSNQKIFFEPLKIELSGNLTLSAGNQTVDLTSLVKNNPMFIRELSQMLSEEIGNRMNGGKSLMGKSYI